LDIQIENIKIRFNIGEDKQVKELLVREFNSFIKVFSGKPNISINIKYSEFITLKNVKYYGDNIISNKEFVAQNMKAHLRNIWIKYSISSYFGSHIDIYLSNKKKNQNFIEKWFLEIKKVISPNFLFPWQNSLIDFIHGPFIGIVQLQLLKNTSLFLHASSINKNDNGIILVGLEQSGKSTIADYFTKNEKWQFISEDYCILNNKNEVLGYNKQRRFFLKQLKETNYKIFSNNILRTILEILNISIFGLMKRKTIRVLCISEVLSIEKIKLKTKIRSVVYIQRKENGKIEMNKIDNLKMVNICSNIMMAEMKNLNGFFNLISCYGIIKQLPNQVNKLFEDIAKIMDTIINKNSCYILNIPQYKNFDNIKNSIDGEFKKIINYKNQIKEVD